MNKKAVETLSTISVSVLIPVYQDTAGLETTLKSLIDAGVRRPDTEIIVCNDGGGREISRVVSSFAVREALLEKNQGSYSARNRGIEIAQGNILAFLDADQRVDPGWMDAGIRALDQADYAGGRIVVEPGTEPSVWEEYDVLTAFPVKKYLEELHFAPTANLFVRRDVLRKVGLFDERLRSGGDFEFGRRVFAAGFRQTYASEAVTYHPARNRAQQAQKIKRVSEGCADNACLFQGRKPLLLFINGLIEIGKVPFETIWRLIGHTFSPSKQKALSKPIFIVIEEQQKLYSQWYMARRAFRLFYNSLA